MDDEAYCILNREEYNDVICQPEFVEVIPGLFNLHPIIKCFYCGMDNDNTKGFCMACNGPMEDGYMAIGFYRHKWQFVLTREYNEN